MQRKLSKPSEGRIKDDSLENGDSFQPFAPPKRHGDVKKPFEASSSGVTSHASIQKHKRSITSGSIQRKVSLTHPDHNNAQYHTFHLPTSSGSRSEHDGNPSPSLKESSYASNIDSSLDHPLQAASLKTNDKGDMLYPNHDALPLSKSFKNENIAIVVPFNSPGSAQHQLHQFENENEGHSVVGGVSIGFSQEIDSSNMQESSSMSSALDKVSLEATSFCQLQQVMDQVLESFVMLKLYFVSFTGCLLDYEVKVNILCI